MPDAADLDLPRMGMQGCLGGGGTAGAPVAGATAEAILRALGLGNELNRVCFAWAAAGCARGSEGHRAISEHLRQALEEVALQHGGKVPIHGRLFFQWLHFAYPMECPYPHVSGTTTLSVSLEEGGESGSKLSVSQAEMRSYVESSPDIPRAAGCNMQDPEQDTCPIAAMWLHEEELVDAAGWNATLAARELAARPAWRRVRWIVRACMVVAILLSCIVSLRHTVQHGLSSLGVAGDQAGKSESKASVISV